MSDSGLCCLKTCILQHNTPGPGSACWFLNELCCDRGLSCFSGDGNSCDYRAMQLMMQYTFTFSLRTGGKQMNAFSRKIIDGQISAADVRQAIESEPISTKGSEEMLAAIDARLLDVNPEDRAQWVFVMGKLPSSSRLEEVLIDLLRNELAVAENSMMVAHQALVGLGNCGMQLGSLNLLDWNNNRRVAGLALSKS